MKINKPNFKNVDWGRVSTYNPFRLLRRPANAMMHSVARTDKKIGANIHWVWLFVFFAAFLGPVTHTINTIWDMWNVYVSDRAASHEFIVMGVQGWLYFTFLSNFGISIYAFMRFMGIANGKRQFHAIAKITLATFITITCVVSWTLLLDDELRVYKEATQGMDGVIAFLSRFFNHLLTPIIFVTVFFLDSEQYEIKQDKGSKVIGWVLITPIIWLIMATIVYYSLGGDGAKSEAHGGGNYSDAFYSFLDFNKMGFWVSTMYIVGIAFLFAMVAWLFGAIAVQKKKLLSGEVEIKPKKVKGPKAPKDPNAPKGPSKIKTSIAKASSKVKTATSKVKDASKTKKVKDIKEDSKDVKEASTEAKKD